MVRYDFRYDTSVSTSHTQHLLSVCTARRVAEHLDALLLFIHIIQ